MDKHLLLTINFLLNQKYAKSDHQRHTLIHPSWNIYGSKTCHFWQVHLSI